MARLRLTCFQSFSAHLDDKPIHFPTAKGRALLVYLALEQTTHQRSSLAGLLWPDNNDSRARRNLSQTLLRLRTSIGDTDSPSPFLQVASQTIAFDSSRHYQIDLLDFEEAITKGDIEQAVSLYTGPFLSDFHLPDSDLFESWMQATRERAQQQVVDALSKLGLDLEAKEQFDEAIHHIRRLLSLAPWQEEAHCQLMRLFARSGQRSAALAQYDTLTQMLMDELGVSPAPETDALYDQILAGEIEPLVESVLTSRAQRPPHSLSEAPFQAPAPPPHFVGRQDEITQLMNGITQSDHRVWALVGMGGSGKTTLAMQVAQLLRGDFADGVLWANTATSQPMDILNQWGTAFGYDYSNLPDLETRASAVRGMLGKKSVLIVLDNVDKLEGVQPLLPGHATCGVLPTTRNLDVAHALNAEALLLGELSSESGVALLRQILGAERVDTEPDAAVQICQLLHYLPLALEITAQRLKSRTRIKLSSMAQRLSQEQHRLGLEISDRAVRTSFEVSWAGLDEEQQRLFAHLAVFAGRPFTVDALAYIVDADPFDVEDLLYGLVALSLLQEEGENNFRQHPLLADFAQEKLGSDSAPLARMVHYYHQFAEQYHQDYPQLESHWDNLLHSIKVAHDLQMWQSIVDFTDLLSEPWMAKARYDDARLAYKWANTAARELHNEAAIATNLTRWGAACVEQNEYDAAAQYLEESLHHYLLEEEEEGIGQTKYLLARIAVERNQFEEAEALIKECLFIHEYNQNRKGIALALYYRADIRYALNDYASAQEVAEEALSLQEAADDQYEMIATLRLLSQIAVRQEDYALAHEYCARAQKLCQLLENDEEWAITLYAQSFIYRSQENFSQAIDAIERSLPVFQKLGLRRIEGMAYYQLGVALKGVEKGSAATEQILASIEIFRQIQDELGLAYSLIVLGDLFEQQSLFNEAEVAWQEALAYGDSYEQPWIQEQVRQRLS